MTDAGSFAPIAIVGRSCLVPGAASPEALWAAVAAGRDLLTATPPGRWRTAPGSVECALGDDWHDRCWCLRGGYVAGFAEQLDPTGFALAAERVRVLDPLVQWVLHTARAALADTAAPLDRDRCGIIFGNLGFPSDGLSRFAEATWLRAQGHVPGALRLAERLAARPEDRFMSGLPAFLARQALGLGGVAFTLDAACASSLYAIKLACDRLHDGSADVMLAGAVNRADDLFIHVGFCALAAMSTSGRSRPFHRAADGLVPAEGAGFVVLKRLADALAAGDRIHGVIRAVGLADDGRGGGLLAPAAAGQVRAMERAWRAAGLDPATASLIECHATGTPVGDGVEVEAMRRVFAGAADLPIGSLKSNLGHLITAAGVAGLVKVLEALRHGVRPPTLHADEPLAALAGSFLRPLTAAEPWPAGDGPRRAAVSAFGFGGNNAHLIVEELDPELVAAPVTRMAAPVAIVAVGARVASLASAVELDDALRSGRSLLRPGVDGAAAAMDEVVVGLTGLRFPPRDLAQALAQQTALLEAAREAVAATSELPAATTGVVVGLGADPEVARYGARWRMTQWANELGIDDSGWVDSARTAFVDTLEAAGVVGTMPNIPANRVTTQLDLGGASMTVAAEEASGLVALEVARRAVAVGELDAAVVGAVDFSCEPVHRAAAAALLPADRQLPGDAAVAVVLKRLADAERDGDRVLALLGDLDDDAAERCGLAPGVDGLVDRLGHPHAASGLLHVVAAIFGLAGGRRPDGSDWADGVARRVRVVVEAMTGVRHEVVLAAPAAVAALPGAAAGAVIRLAAHPPAVVWPALPALAAILRCPVVDAEIVARAVPDPHRVERMPLAPALPPVLEVAAAAERPPLPPASVAVSNEVLARAQAMIAHAAAAHRAFLAEQARAHQSFLALRELAARELARAAAAYRAGGAVVASPRPAAPPTPPPAPVATPVAVAPAAAALLPPSGPTFSRAELELHAGGRISGLYGELFTPQDGYARQVRMPEPPLLLADRVTGLQAEPGAMGLGTIWTETDVGAEEWYLHRGRMPAGVMIEAGQADLMLISYLGVDLLNRGERVYRLLGCELTYHGDLPRPGETPCYDIHVDGHARQGEVRLFFFHSDCRVDGEGRLSVRHGQAGFFTEGELAESAGVLWDAAAGEPEPEPRLDPLPAACRRTELDRADLEALAAGQPWRVFGAEWDWTRTHTLSPAIAGGRLLLLDRVTELAPSGGPWGRGYLRAVTPVAPDDWFFAGHFKNDPCMPGTLMFEGCLEAMAVLMLAMGFSRERDGWRFQPVSDRPYQLICRGQVVPSSRELVYEIFVHEVVAGPRPTLVADVLCTVDGLKAFHGRKVALELVPDWPLEADPSPLADLVEGDEVAEVDGFRYGYASLLASALGRPSAAFGPMYRPFDGPRRVARLPGPPYHFMSRLSSISHPPGGFAPGVSIELAYDVPPDAWYFAANGARVMPFCVLLEAALQPCGWLASYVGSALKVDDELSFRNLDGQGHLYTEIGPDVGTLTTRVTITAVSRTGAMIIEAFEVECFLGERLVWQMHTVFGFFPAVALQNQVGLPTTDDQRLLLTADGGEEVDLRAQPERFCAGSLRVAGERLRTVDRVTWWANGGSAGLGRLRALTAVDPDAWFFKAHFFSDPVQPGSLGLEAMLQLLQVGMIAAGWGDGLAEPRFEPLALDTPLVWKYRGQVLPSDREVTVTLDLVAVERDARSVTAVAEGSLWVDGRRIYEARNLGMRIVAGR